MFEPYRNRVIKGIAFVMAILIAASLVLFSGTAVAAGAGNSGETTFLSEKGTRIGVEESTIQEQMARELYPDAEIYYYNKIEGYTAVAQGKLDAFLYEKMQMDLAIKNGLQGVRVLDETIGDPTMIALAVSDGSDIPDLKAKVNQFIAEIKSDGTFDDMYERWMVDGNYIMPDIKKAKNPEYVLKVATSGDVEPFSFYKDNTITGFDMEMMQRFALQIGADLQVETYNWNALMVTTQTGKADIIASNLQYTPERAESIDYSDVYLESYTGVMAADDGMAVPSEDLRDTLSPDGETVSEPEYQIFEELRGKTISMLTGAPFEELISAKVGDVGEFTYFQTMPDMTFAIKERKTDAGFMNNAVAEFVANRDERLSVFPESLGETAFGLAFAKGDKRCAEWDEVYERIPQETKDMLWKKWTGADDSIKTVPEQDWPGENGTVRVAACDALEPMSYVGQDGKLLGLDIETILLMAKELDVHVEFMPMDFSAVLSSIGSGKADIGCGSIVTTDERKETMDFVEYQPAFYVLLVRSKSAVPENHSIFGNVRESFYKTFIREDRYKLFLQGILTTILITLVSILLGTVLGFLVFMGCRRGKKIANGLSGFFVWLVQGMPVVVLLMILYYIIFAKTQMSGVVVAVIAFTLVFGSGVFGMLKMGVGAVDKGQTEAALSLGYGDIHSFFRIILPQAVPHFLPTYKGEVVSLIKATAIVGYIAVQDLTKMGDIIRGRTYEAFFPLIAVAVIYFILGGLLTFTVGMIEKLIDPKRRKREDILKGVKVHD